MATQLSVTEDGSTDEVNAETEGELLELLGDEYTRRVLAAVTEQPRCGSEVVEATGVSKATAYRRLSDLEEAGLVASQMIFDPDGHHHEQFHAVVEAIDITVDTEGLSVAVERAGDKSEESVGRR
jgi:predicted transcriptional regulator